MGQLIFNIKCPDGIEGDINTAIETTYGKPSSEVIAGFIWEVYSSYLIKNAVKAAQEQATSTAGAVVIGDHPKSQDAPAEVASEAQS